MSANWYERANGPVIVIGMHRSGTSMITRALTNAGLFMGSDKEDNDESRFFIAQNEWILSARSSRWDNIGAFNDCYDERLFNLEVDYLAARLSGTSFLRYAGKNRRFFLSNWGWKDPRNTVTLKHWLKIFPGAKVLRINRHGVDVALSLVARSEKYLEASLSKQNLRRRIFPYLSKNNGFTDSAISINLEAAFELWHSYNKVADENTKHLSEQNVFSMNYEDFLSEPKSTIIRLEEFLGIELSAENFLKESIDRSKAYSYKNNPVAKEFGESKGCVLRKYGYL